MTDKWIVDLKFIETGDVYFFYKPKKNIEKVSSINDVGRFFVVLQPENKDFSRFIVMGGKKMPTINDGGDTTWGFIQMVGGRGFEVTKAQTQLQKKGASRPAGEGIYALVAHRGHTHLLYTLELPTSLGIVQRSFNIQKSADYVFLVRPVEQSPNSIDIPFSNFSAANINDLNKRGTEVLLVGVGADFGRMGIKAYTESESLNSADLFSRLKVSSDRHPTNSLITGNWV